MMKQLSNARTEVRAEKRISSLPMTAFYCYYTTLYDVRAPRFLRSPRRSGALPLDPKITARTQLALHFIALGFQATSGLKTTPPRSTLGMSPGVAALRGR
jgi:hypothetical protein